MGNRQEPIEGDGLRKAIGEESSECWEICFGIPDRKNWNKEEEL